MLAFRFILKISEEYFHNLAKDYHLNITPIAMLSFRSDIATMRVM